MNIRTVLKTLLNEIIELKNTKLDIDKVKNISKQRGLEFVVTKGANYEYATVHNVLLVGNILRIYFTANRNSATGTGNITQDTIFTIKIYTQDLFTDAYNSTSVNYTTGTLHNFSTGYKSTGSDEKGNYVQFNVQINATHGGVVGTSGTIFLPVILNTDNY